MIVEPYRRNPAPPTVALLLPDGTILDERGDRLDPDDWPPSTVAFSNYDTVRELVSSGRGEALCWNSEEIRWRAERYEDEWRRRPSDVSVLRLPFPPEPELALQGLGRWRDWLAGYGASPTGTTGSAAWSLLRATLRDVLFCSLGDAPPILQTIGGRVELGPAGPGSFRGRIVQLDLQAAYTQEIGRLYYGGRWYARDHLPVGRPVETWAVGGRPVFVRAVLQVPRDLAYGPLIRRPRKRMSQLALFFSQVYENRYPTGRRIQGVWTWQEIAAAEAWGARLLQVKDYWVHLAAVRPFAPWIEAVWAGRRMGGFAGLLAKTTGNALWGRFCMDSRAQGTRTIRGRQGGRVRSRPLPLRGGPPPAHDLAETVSGRVRASLFDRMMTLGPNLISAHTDGVWAYDPGPTTILPPALSLTAAEWRRKQPARGLDLIDPQTLRYWPRPAHPEEPHVVMAGVPAKIAAASFQKAWERGGYSEAAGAVLPSESVDAAGDPPGVPAGREN